MNLVALSTHLNLQLRQIVLCQHKLILEDDTACDKQLTMSGTLFSFSHRFQSFSALIDSLVSRPLELAERG
ncbi:hypothetical protein INR49_028223 [Caranx melampygus]|nr:hypothetical protein INR49_028223 [Caranx melampygus]